MLNLIFNNILFIDNILVIFLKKVDTRFKNFLYELFEFPFTGIILLLTLFLIFFCFTPILFKKDFYLWLPLKFIVFFQILGSLLLRNNKIFSLDLLGYSIEYILCFFLESLLLLFVTYLFLLTINRHFLSVYNFLCTKLSTMFNLSLFHHLYYCNCSENTKVIAVFLLLLTLILNVLNKLELVCNDPETTPPFREGKFLNNKVVIKLNREIPNVFYYYFDWFCDKIRIYFIRSMLFVFEYFEFLH